jgi:hypothetical protein
MSAIFGGKKSQSTQESGNTNAGLINQTFGGVANQTGESINQLQALLGGDASGFRNFANAIDLGNTMERGARGITSAGAARGLLRSGATGMALQDYNQAISNQAAGSYMDRLMGIGQMGLGAGQLMTSAGQFSRGQSTSKEKPGMGKFIGSVIGAAAAGSDARLKEDITPVGRNADGLTVYQYRYKGEPEVYTGVMAQEVAKKKPSALGPMVNGFLTVDYSKINIIDRS